MASERERRLLWPTADSAFLRHESNKRISYACPAYRASDLFVLGEDEQLDREQRQAKRRRIVKLSKSFLAGESLFISSAALKGPFGKKNVFRSAGYQDNAQLPNNVPKIQHTRNPKTQSQPRAAFVPRSNIDGTRSVDDHSPTLATPTPIRSYVPSKTPRPHQSTRARRLSAVVLPRLSQLNETSSFYDASSIRLDSSFLPEPGETVSNLIKVATPIVEHPINTENGSRGATSPHESHHSPVLVHDEVDLEQSRAPSQASPQTSNLPVSPLDKECIARAKALSQQAPNRHAVEQRRKSGKLASLNRFPSLASIRAKNQDCPDFEGTSPFVFRKVGQRTVDPAAPEDAPKPAQDADTPPQSTQAMLDQAHLALMHTIRRGNDDRASETARRQHSRTQYGSCSPALATHRTVDPPPRPDNGAHIHPVDTQAMFDAFSPFAMSRRTTIEKPQSPTPAQPQGEADEMEGLGFVDAAESRDEVIEQSAFIRDAQPGTFTELSAPLPAPSAHGSKEHNITTAEDHAYNRSPSQSLHHPRLPEAGMDTILTATGLSASTTPGGSSHEDFTSPQSHVSAPRSKSTSPPSDAPAPAPASLGNADLANNPASSLQPSHESQKLLVPRSPPSTGLFAAPSLTPLAPNTLLTPPRADTRPGSFANAQFSPSVDFDMSLADLQESILGPAWDVNDVIRNGVDAV